MTGNPPCAATNISHWWCYVGHAAKAWARPVDQQERAPDGTLRPEHFNLEFSGLHNIRARLANLHISSNSDDTTYSWQVYDWVSRESFPLLGGRFMKSSDDAANIAVSLLRLEMQTRVPDTTDFDYFCAPHDGKYLADGLAELVS
jgi:hypothetical protein